MTHTHTAAETTSTSPTSGQAPCQHIGPASVISTAADGSCTCMVGDAPRSVRMAMPVDYQPRPGDLLLVLASAQEAWAVGVLQGSGPVNLRSAGDICLESTAGNVQIRSAGRSQIQAQQVEVRAEDIALTSTTFRQRCTDFTQRIARLLRLHSTRRQVDIEEHDRLRAGQVDLRCQGNVHLDGKHIHLG